MSNPADPPPSTEARPASAADSLMAKITDTTNLLKAVIGLLGLLLPTVVVTKIIQIPSGLGLLVKIITVPTSVVAVVGIFLLGHVIRRWTIGRALTVFLICALIGSTSAVTFYLFAPSHVFTCEGERMVSPMFDSKRIRDIIEPSGNDYCRALRRSPVSAELRRRLTIGSIPTVIAMVLLMVATVLFSVGAMVGIAWKAIVGTEAADTAGGGGRP